MLVFRVAKRGIMASVKSAKKGKATAASPKRTAKGKAGSAKKAVPRAAQVAKVAAPKPKPRADLGAPVEVFFARQLPNIRPITDALRKMVEQALPDADSVIKWGMPFYSVNGEMICAIGGHKAHVNLILAGTPESFSDPEGLLEGEGKTGKHLKVKRIEDIPGDAVRAWLRTLSERARRRS
jgi:hypothetical protein